MGKRSTHYKIMSRGTPETRVGTRTCRTPAYTFPWYYRVRSQTSSAQIRASAGRWLNRLQSWWTDQTPTKLQANFRAGSERTGFNVDGVYKPQKGLASYSHWFSDRKHRTDFTADSVHVTVRYPRCLVLHIPLHLSKVTMIVNKASEGERGGRRWLNSIFKRLCTITLETSESIPEEEHLPTACERTNFGVERTWPSIRLSFSSALISDDWWADDFQRWRFI